MAAYSEQFFAGLCLLGLLAVAAPADAKPRKGWVDPPPDLSAMPAPTDAKAQPAPAAASEIHSAPDEAARRWRPSTNVAQPTDVTATGSIETTKAETLDSGAVKAAARLAHQEQARNAIAEAARASAARKARQERAAEAKRVREARQQQAVEAKRVREAQARAQARTVAAARERRRIAERVPEASQSGSTGLQVMILRTLIGPDGRMVQVLAPPEE